jgi:hypothetical protein
VPGDSLTFAEAMALDPSEVEGEYPGGGVPWQLLTVLEGCTVKFLRTCTFRRARPKRSRVQELCEQAVMESGVSVGTRAIRAVCEYLRKQGGYGPAPDDIEHEFLVPR